MTQVFVRPKITHSVELKVTKKLLSAILSTKFPVERHNSKVPTRHTRSTKVILGGGLGNQLFQYFAGLYVSKKTGTELLVESTFSQFNRTGHSDWINALKLPGKISKEAPRGSFAYLRASLSRMLSSVAHSAMRNPKSRLSVLRQYRSPVLGHDPLLDSIGPGITIKGFFQTWVYYRRLIEQGQAPSIDVLAPSEWFKEMSDELDANGPVLGIHLRRGDYIDNPEIGILSSQFYEQAISELQQRGVMWKEVWVFSDEIDKAKEVVNQIKLVEPKVRFVLPDKSSHSIESMLLMARASSLIIANSTFSWWGAMLGDENRQIICPKKWFRHWEDPTELCPESWIRVESFWEG